MSNREIVVDNLSKRYSDDALAVDNISLKVKSGQIYGFLDSNGAGLTAQNLVHNIESGYFDKLLLMPTSLSTLPLGPILAGALILGLQISIAIGVCSLLGLEPITGTVGLLTLIGLAVLLGTGFAGFTVSAASGSGSAAVTQSAGFIFFPLTFLTASFVPLDLLDNWLRTAARVNPITYVLGAMRDTINLGWVRFSLWQGIIACLLPATAMYALAVFALRARTRRR